MQKPRKDPLYLYLLVRTDLDSMGAGKGIAHGGHGVSKFCTDIMHLKTQTSDADASMGEQFDNWAGSFIRKYWEWEGGRGFGVKISKAVNYHQLITAIAVAESIPDLMAGLITDPTYPYIVNREYARLIDHRMQVSDKTLAEEDINPDNAPTPLGDSGDMLCLREETSAGYVFGPKSVADMVVRQFPLFPEHI